MLNGDRVKVDGGVPAAISVSSLLLLLAGFARSTCVPGCAAINCWMPLLSAACSSGVPKPSTERPAVRTAGAEAVAATALPAVADAVLLVTATLIAAVPAAVTLWPAVGADTAVAVPHAVSKEARPVPASRARACRRWMVGCPIGMDPL